MSPLALEAGDLSYLFLLLFSESGSLSESGADCFSGKLWGFVVGIVCTITPSSVPPTPAVPRFYAGIIDPDSGPQPCLASALSTKALPRPSWTLLYN